ncbi:sulfotransferase domain-containing protein [Moorena producens JHB]|uniref:Sulfotransferase domain-containing protein n=1 Tax=Moorena producens (strain JHB) TaxID=1454205 RepID=A0A1D9FWY5_MOOP1|nr:sulfotransferase domain-containing protein [Moorena producens]AOY79876.1 sulfotransferase domain-containing protein [Moorena producens JHB]
MTLPNFLIIGAQKAGTTWLAHNLREHPEVFIPGNEIHYFNKTYNLNQGIEWYKNHFADVNGEKVIGEKTPNYLWIDPLPDAQGKVYYDPLEEIPYSHRLIYETLPEAKLIVVLRNPVERAIAAINHFIKNGAISLNDDLDELLVGDQQPLVERYGIIDMGRYYRQLQGYYDYFDPKQMLILVFEEDIAQNSDDSLKKVCEFLEIDSSFDFSKKSKKVHKSTSSPIARYLGTSFPFMRGLINRVDQRLPLQHQKLRPSPSAIQKLYTIYANDNQKLFKLLGREISAWHSKELVGLSS